MLSRRFPVERFVRVRLSVLVLAAALASPASAATLRQFEGLGLSADGERVAAIESEAEPDAAEPPHGAIVIRSVADGREVATLDPCRKCVYSGLAYAPDGRRLAFVARERGAARAKLMLATGTSVSTLATVEGLVQQPRWSPDGRTVAMLATIGARKEAGAVQAGARQVGEIGSSEDAQRIAVVPAAGGAMRLVSPAGRYVYEYGWTPDGKGFVATSATGNGDANWWVATLDAIDLASGQVRTIARPAMQMNEPTVSPDGRRVAFIGGLMSDFGSVGGDVWTVPFAGGEPKDATRGYQGTFTSIDWSNAGLRATALLADRAAIVAIDPDEGPRPPSWTAQATPAAGDGKAAFAGGRVAMVAQDWSHGPAIFAGPVARPVQLTHDNDGYAPLASARSLTWKNGTVDAQGWLLAPRGQRPAGKAPMITIVHGGPSAASTPSFVWQGSNAALLRAGYWLFYPNPRGSYGQGEAFTAANRRDFGGGDLEDILAGVDAAVRAAPIDAKRLGMMGGSYGGFMTMWANTQTNRFKGIVTIAGISNWISYYGTNGINTWMIPFFGKSAYQDHDVYWKMSALKDIAKARTPTLILVGERDIEVPPTQSMEYWNALKAVNVPASLVIYQDEGHGIRSPANARDASGRTVAWFDRYVKGAR